MLKLVQPFRGIGRRPREGLRSGLRSLELVNRKGVTFESGLSSSGVAALGSSSLAALSLNPNPASLLNFDGVLGKAQKMCSSRMSRRREQQRSAVSLLFSVGTGMPSPEELPRNKKEERW
jgi:hypothetical protein